MVSFARVVSVVWIPEEGEGGLQYGTDGDARRKF